jgi:hypothetical protein
MSGVEEVIGEVEPVVAAAVVADDSAPNKRKADTFDDTEEEPAFATAGLCV